MKASYAGRLAALPCSCQHPSVFRHDQDRVTRGSSCAGCASGSGTSRCSRCPSISGRTSTARSTCATHRSGVARRSCVARVAGVAPAARRAGVSGGAGIASCTRVTGCALGSGRTCRKRKTSAQRDGGQSTYQQICVFHDDSFSCFATTAHRERIRSSRIDQVPFH